MPDKDDISDCTCSECHGVHPSEPFASDFAICLQDPEFDPYIDEIIERQDFSRCQELVQRKRFPWDRTACDKFAPIDDLDEGEEAEWSPELTAKMIKLAQSGELTGETLKQAMLEDAVSRIDWANRSIDNEVRELAEAKSFDERKQAVRRFGGLIAQGNRAAFDALAAHLRDLPPPESAPEKGLRIEILRQLRFTSDPDSMAKLAHLLVDDLFRTPSNNTTRTWYTEVFRYFERFCPRAAAVAALQPMLDSPQFSYRIKKRVRGILDRLSGTGQW